MLWWVCLLCLSLIDAQMLTSMSPVTGFNLNATTDLGFASKFYLSYNFIATDALTSNYTLKLVSIFEAKNVGGNFIQDPANILAVGNYQPVLPVPPVVTNTLSSNVTITFSAKAQNPISDPLQSLVFSHTYWLPASGKNSCPDANGRFCLKFTQSFTYSPRVQGQSLVFHWQLFENQVMGTTLNTLPVQNQVLNNLAFFSVENTALITDFQQNTHLQPVNVFLRTDNITTNGIWVVYNFPVSTAIPFAVKHDPVVGVNLAPAALSIQIVTAALSAVVVVVFIVILSCSIYIYHGNTKDYYIKLRIRQELQ